MAKQFVNVYAVSLVYGGPEEGGWWYDRYFPVSSFGFSSRRKSKQAMKRKYSKEVVKAERENSQLENYTSVRGGLRYEVLIQDHKAVNSGPCYYC